MSLKKCLQIAGVDANVDKHTFWIHSNSMKAAVQLLSDKSIEVTWSLYCQSDDVVTIHIRTAKDPSPNTSKASSHNNSLAERRHVSGQRRKVSEIFIRTPLDHITSGLDAATLEPIRDLDDNDKVTLNIGGGKSETFSKDYLLGKKCSGFYFMCKTNLILGWITAQDTAGKAVSNITVSTMTQNRRPKEIVLTDDIWHTSLLRGPWKEES